MTLAPHSCAHRLLAAASEKPLSAAELKARAERGGMNPYTDLVIQSALAVLLEARYLRRVGEKQYVLLPAGASQLQRIQSRVQTETLSKHGRPR